MITPTNQHVHVKPIPHDSGVMATHDKNYDEKGIALSAQDFMEFKIGDTIYFDSWEAAKYNEDTPDEFWLVPYHAIRAYEVAT